MSMKLNCTNYCDFMDKTFFAWYKFQYCSFQVSCPFMHDNIPSHVSKLPCEFFDHEIFTEKMIIEWLLSTPDLNSVENLWSIVKMANDITAKQTYGKQLKLLFKKLNIQNLKSTN